MLPTPTKSFCPLLALANIQTRNKEFLPEMERGVGIFLCLLLVTMDISAGILGIEAEIAQNKVCLKLILFLMYIQENLCTITSTLME